MNDPDYQPTPLSQHRAHLPEGVGFRILYRIVNFFGSWENFLTFLAVTILIVATIGIRYNRAYNRKADPLVGPEMQGAATFMRIIYNRTQPTYITFRLAERIILKPITTADLPKMTQIPEGTVVRVTYRQGKSGAMYITDWSYRRGSLLK